jgi:hypothetical protein
MVKHVSNYKEMRNAHKILVRKHQGRIYLGDPGVNGRIILKYT